MSDVAPERFDRDRRDAQRLMGLIDLATDSLTWVAELDADGRDAIAYDDDPVGQWERRVRESEVAALGAIAFLLLRRDDEMWEAWRRY
jgi:hypothetical protein